VLALDLPLASEPVEDREHGRQCGTGLGERVEHLPGGEPVGRRPEGVEHRLFELPAGARSLSCHPRILRRRFYEMSNRELDTCRKHGGGMLDGDN
jgi:hypothetical protein